MYVLLMQTEEERQIRKMVRRDEKKQIRRKDGERGVVDSANDGFNPQELRNRRFVARLKF